MQRQLSAFLESNKLLHDTQSGFRVGYSTETALLEVTETVRETLDKGKQAMLVLLDLTAAFDTVSHTILLDRLVQIGVIGTTLAWFKSLPANSITTLYFQLSSYDLWSTSGIGP